MTDSAPRRRARQERSIRTERAILEAAGEVFDQYGYAAATLSMIMERAKSGEGVTKGALYHHFESKLDLARVILERQVPMSTLPPQSSKVQEAIDTSFGFVYLLQTDPLARAGARLSTDGGLPPEIDGQSTFNAWAEHGVNLLTQARDREQMLPNVTPREAAETIVGSFIGIQLTSQAIDDRESLPRRVSTLWQLILPGIAVPGLLPGLDFAPDRLSRVGGLNLPATKPHSEPTP
ncbi:ScbR family autoregulator-binding transcription factor [Streptomyces sp. NPDC002476]|uniref:ScbR family autoregulator-binding transcription factor n=1 Tax=Streptomyces sp. NPDC002476 TaxID=3364648 RepID=UPI0036B2A9AB